MNDKVPMITIPLAEYEELTRLRDAVEDDDLATWPAAQAVVSGYRAALRARAEGK